MTRGDDDIYGGILTESVGKYVPVGAITTEKSPAYSDMVNLKSAPAVHDCDKLLQVCNLLPVQEDMIKDIYSDDEDIPLTIIPRKEEIQSKNREKVKEPPLKPPQELDPNILAPFKDFILHQAEKDKLLQEQLERAAEESLQSAKSQSPASKFSSSVPAVSKGIIHRGIFDGLDNASKIPDGGQAMGYGSYDMFSNINRYESMDSDNDDDEEATINKSVKRRKKK